MAKKPTFFERMKSFGSAVQLAMNPQRYQVVTVMGNGQEVTRLVDYDTYCAEGYERNTIVYACVREISRQAPSARLQVKRRLPQGQTEIKEDHYLQTVMDFPNPHQSAFDFIELLNTYLNLDGNVFILREKEGSKTRRLWMPRPDRMTPVVDRSRSVWDSDALLGFVYTSGSGEKLAFMPEDVFHIKYPNPNDPFGGLGRGIPPLQAAAIEVDIDNTASAFTHSFFQKGMVPSGIFKSKNILSDSEVKRIRARLNEQYGGVDNAGSTLILDADAEYQKMGLNMEELAFPDLRAISETRICAAFKVPPILVGIKAGLDASTYSNYTQARRSMWEDNIIPTDMKLAEKLTSGLRNELGENVVLEFDFSKVVALQEDRSARSARANQGVMGGWMTVNEGRREVNLGPVPGGDVFLRPLMSTPVDDGPGDVSLGKGGEMVPLTKLAGHQGKLLAVDEWPEELGEKAWKRFDQVARSHELAFVKAAKARFKAERNEIIAQIRSDKGLIKKAAYDEIWKAIELYLMKTGELWAEDFEPLMMLLLKEQSEAWAGVLGISWDISNPEVEAFIRTYAYSFSEKIGLTTRTILQSTFSSSLAEGWSITKLIDEVAGIYDGWDFIRSEMIARSETIRASNAGAMEAYRQSGVMQIEWWTTMDERACDFCGEMQKRKQIIGEVWQQFGSEMLVNGEKLVIDYEDVLYPPLHPNCRCTILPVIED